MTQKHKKQKELHQLNEFRTLLPDFPQGKVTCSEKPDFLVQSDHRTVGIEVTSIFADVSSGKTPLQVQESERRQLLNHAKQIYEAKNLPPLNVSVLFGGETKFNKHNRAHFADILANLVALNVPSSKGFHSIHNNYDSQATFPFEICSVNIGRFDFPNSSFISNSLTWFIQEDFAIDLQKVIADKDNLVPSYQTCHYYWLLVVSEWVAPSSFFDPSLKTLSTVYQSVFDRVFFLNMFDHNLSQLSILKRAP